MRIRNVILIAIILSALSSPSFADAPSIGGMPYVIYNSTYGVEYGVIGKLKNYLGAEESIALSTVIIERGGSNNIFTASLPDADFRHGKVFPFAVDIEGEIGTLNNERFNGIGMDTSADDYTTFTNAHNRIRVRLSRAVSESLILEADLHSAINEFSDLAQGESPLTSEAKKVSRSYNTASFRVTLDRRDSSMEPRKGDLLLFNVDLGLQTPGSRTEFSKFGIDLRRYDTPFRADQVLASRVAVAQMRGSAIPIYEYAILGGRDTLRGYTINRFRGESFALLNLEYRFPIYGILGGAAFFEGGKVAERVERLGFDGWATDFGAGIRLNFGNIIVRGDFARGQEGTNAYFFYNQAF